MLHGTNINTYFRVFRKALLNKVSSVNAYFQLSSPTNSPIPVRFIFVNIR